MRTFLRRSLAASALVMPLLLASLAGCAPTGGASTSGASTGGATATARAATTTVAPINTPSLTMPPTMRIASGACGPHFPDTMALTSAGGLAVTQTSGMSNLAYPETQIPSGQPAAPMLAPDSVGTTSGVAGAALLVNPGLTEKGGGHVLFVCNPSSQPHTLSAARVSIAAVEPFTDQLGAWAPCQGAYYPVGGYVSGGCGGADFETEYMHATFGASAQTGATVTTTQTGTNMGMSGAAGDLQPGPLPVALQPGQMMTIEIGVTPPSAPGYYTYAFSLTVDGASTGVVTYSPMTLIAPVARIWSGAACKTNAMQAKIAQMPTPTQNTAYICPAA